MLYLYVECGIDRGQMVEMLTFSVLLYDSGRVKDRGGVPKMYLARSGKRRSQRVPIFRSVYASRRNVRSRRRGGWKLEHACFPSVLLRDGVIICIGMPLAGTRTARH